MASSSRSSRHHKTSSSRGNIPRTEIKIHVYDLLPPSRLSSFLWTVGSSLLHSGVVIKDKEYAYGGHNKRGVTGVYWTRPKLEPPGGTFRTEILQGFTFYTDDEISKIISEVSAAFDGSSYNLLTRNCNTFTSALCEKLTSKPSPSWLNRAASIGLALPCVVPREWISPPDHETADGALVENEEEDEHDERASMLHSDRNWHREQPGTPPPRLVNVKDAGGRNLPVSERAPMPRQGTLERAGG